MLIAKRHPTMKRAASAERGVMGTYALGVMAVAGSLLTAGLLFGGARPAFEPMPETNFAPVTLSPEEAQAWSESDPTLYPRVPGEHARAFEGVEAGKETSFFYDESASVVITTNAAR